VTTRKPSISAKAYAHAAGVLYLVNIACGVFGELFVRGKLVVAGDATATAHHILASESLFRWGIAGDLLMHITDVPMAVIFYVLLRPVSRDLSLLAALFGMLQTAILCANKLNLISVLLLLGGSSSLQAFTPAQLQSLASLSLTLHESGFGVGLVFFGVSCLVSGYLLYRSGYFPRTLGVLQTLAGICYLINSFALILRPPLAAKMFPTILIPAFVGELGTCIWLLVMGLNQPRWDERIRLGPVMEGPADF
jgi:hypothetical protein